MGLSEGADFIPAENLFPSLDFSLSDLLKRKKLAVWGRGHVFHDLLQAKKLDLSTISFIISSSAKSGEMYESVPVLNPESVQYSDDLFIVVAVRDSFYEIERKLKELGVPDDAWIAYDALLTDNASLMRKVYFASAREDMEKVCNLPFEMACVWESGDVTSCCWQLLSVPFGNVWTTHIKTIWSSTTAKILRLSCINRSYVFCDTDRCPYLRKLKREGPPAMKDAVPEENPYEHSSGQYPAAVNFAIDTRCNLYCRSCRRTRFEATREYIVNKQKLTKILVEEFSNTDLDWILIGGTGEGFLNDTYDSLTVGLGQDHPKRRLILQTNGTLFSEEKWERYSSLYDKIGIRVSIDAATKETYEKLRRGGNWDALKRNLERIAKMRRDGSIDFLLLAFVLQKDNIHELQSFVEMAKSLSADGVYVSKLDNWGSFTDEEYADASAIGPDGKIREDLKDCLTEELLSESIVDFSNTVDALGGGGSTYLYGDYPVSFF